MDNSQKVQDLKAKIPEFEAKIQDYSAMASSARAAEDRAVRAKRICEAQLARLNEKLAELTSDGQAR